MWLKVNDFLALKTKKSDRFANTVGSYKLTYLKQEISAWIKHEIPTCDQAINRITCIVQYQSLFKNITLCPSTVSDVIVS